MNADIRVVNEFLESILQHPKTPDELRCNDTFYKWDESLPYSSDFYAAEVEKDPNKDFVILNFADIQCHDGEAFSQVGEFYEETIDKLIKKVQPDLITLTGDNAFDPMAYLKLIKFLDSYNIPWAPVMGNADHTGLVSEFWADYQLAESKNCLFDYGPEGMGDGNYIVNITENGKIIHTIFCMDSRHEDEKIDFKYDHFHEDQMAWYKWAVEGIKAEAGKAVPSTVVMHVPVTEYQNAWDSVYNKETGELAPEYKGREFCKVHEGMGTPYENNGFFDLAKELGSTKYMICGHDHKNCFDINYEGITLIYGMKTGYGCYWERETNGGTTLTIGSDGLAKIDHHYIDPTQSKVKKFMLEYYGVNLYDEGNVVHTGN